MFNESGIGHSQTDGFKLTNLEEDPKIVRELVERRDYSLFYTLLNVRNKASDLLKGVVKTFPEYTSHDVNHSESVLEKMDLLIPDSLMKELNSHEIYFLIASTYIHDTGMVAFPKLKESELFKFDDEIDEQTEEQKKKIRDFIREIHHIRSEKICKLIFGVFLGDEHQAEIIGRICRGHRKDNLHDTSLFNSKEIYKTKSINVPLLASLLRIGDELDLNFERTPCIVYENIPPKDKISKEEWKKHLAIGGVALDPEDHLTIRCSATCRNPKIHRSLKNLQAKIEYMLLDLPSHLNHYRKYINEIPRTFVLDIKSEGYKPYDFKFSLQEKEIINLLMGDKLYRSKGECIRELLKNAVDACRYRRELLFNEGINYTPNIKFELNFDKSKLTVIDNGTGMDEYIVENHFTKIGKSFYGSDEFKKYSHKFSPISELGIGFLSSFMLADKIIVETKTDDKEPILIEIDDVSDYFFVKPCNKKEVGTKITLFLREDAKEINLKEVIELYAVHIEFPIEVFFEEEHYFIENRGFLPNKLESLSLTADKLNCKLISTQICESFVEGEVAFLIPGKAWLNYPDYNAKNKKNVQDLFYIESPFKYLDFKGFIDVEGYSYVSNEGIYVNSQSFEPDWLLSCLCLDINLKQNILDLNASRNQIVENEKYFNFQLIIEKIFFNTIISTLEKIRSNCINDDLQFRKYCEFFLNEFLSIEHIDPSIFESTNFKHKNRSKSQRKSYVSFIRTYFDAIENSLSEFTYLKHLTREGIFYVNSKEILKIDGEIIFLQSVPCDSDLNTILPKCSGFRENCTYFVLTDIARLLLFNIELKIPEFFKRIKRLEFCDFLGISDIKHIEFPSELRGLQGAVFKNLKDNDYIGFKYHGNFFFDTDKIIKIYLKKFDLNIYHFSYNSSYTREEIFRNFLLIIKACYENQQNTVIVGKSNVSVSLREYSYQLLQALISHGIIINRCDFVRYRL